MIIQEQHLEFKLRSNKLNSNHYQDLKPYQIDRFLHSAAVWMCNHYGEMQKFNASQFNKDLFSTLLIKYPEQPEVDISDFVDNQYRVDLTQLEHDYFHLDRAYIKCGEQLIPVNLITHDEQHKFNDKYQKPNFKWKRLPGIVASNESLYIYSDVDLTDYKVRVEYVKFPKKVFFGNYDTVEYLACVEQGGSACEQYNSATDAPVNSELPNTYHDLQVDVAVWLATSKTENLFLNQFIQQKVSALPK